MNIDKNSTHSRKEHRNDRHYGEIVELTIRKHGYSIAELARLTSVNRRTLYNWFNQKHLSVSVIYRIGEELKHDFSKQLPELFDKNDFIFSKTHNTIAENKYTIEEIQGDGIWKEKYINLLENYNSLLITFPHIARNIETLVA